MKIKLHINKNADIYYSKMDETRGVIYSFTPDFEDIWYQEDQDTYNDGDDLTQSVINSLEFVKPIIRKYKNQLEMDKEKHGATKKRINKSIRISKMQNVIEEMLQEMRVKF